MAFLVNPSSRGYVTLASANPEEPPRIHPRYLSDGSGRDASALGAAFRLLKRLAASPQLAQLLLQERGDSLGLNSEENIAAFVQANVIPFEHAAGTCRMGRRDEVNAVTTADGLVRGMENIVIADASVIPLIPPVPINLTCMMVGWRLAQTVLRTAAM